ncbi:MAG: prepilin-type N-terminal cleavage/methylation domain-containing protein [Polyangiales bacterium]
MSHFLERRRKSARRREGFTLIELMVALVAGIIAVGSVYALSAGSSRHFQDQQRIATTQTSVRMAMEQVRADIERAGFYAPADSNAEPSCMRPAFRIRAVEMTDSSDPTNTDETVIDPSRLNGSESDRLVLVGNFSTSGAYLVSNVLGAGGSLSLQSSWQAFRRDFGVPGTTSGPWAYSASQFEAAFNPPNNSGGIQRVLRLTTMQGQNFYPHITSAVGNMGTPGNPAVINLSPSLPIGGTCMVGLGDGATVAPLTRVEYRVMSPAAAGLTALVGSTPTATLQAIEGSPAVLVRRELTFDNSTPIAGTTRVVLEYVADFDVSFVIDTNARTTTAPNLVRVSGRNAQSAAANTPWAIRSVIVSVSGRTPVGDPKFPVTGGAGTTDMNGVHVPPTRFAPGTGASAVSLGSRVRTMSTEIRLPNLR